jgi:hypothetical protein
MMTACASVCVGNVAVAVAAAAHICISECDALQLRPWAAQTVRVSQCMAAKEAYVALSDLSAKMMAAIKGCSIVILSGSRRVWLSSCRPPRSCHS